MIIWVKEVADRVTVKKVRAFVNNDAIIEPFVDMEAVGPEDCIIVSKTDNAIPSSFFVNAVIVYEDVFEAVTKNILEEVAYNYDYYYLKNALSASQNENIDTIITGSSYGIFGIDCKQLPSAVNLSLISQDMFYSIKGIYKACTLNKNIRNIVLCCSYYFFYSDLSKTQNPGELQRISKVYHPLYGDMHNCKLLPPKRNILFSSNIFDIDGIVDLYAKGKYEKSYFGNEYSRRDYATRIWEDKSKDWSELNEIEREQAGIRRAALHNKNNRWKAAFNENKQLFHELSCFCMSRDIELLVVVVPATKYYRTALCKEFREDFFEVLNEADGIVGLLDSFEDPSFSDGDFNDMDHLSESGAEKLTSAIAELLQLPVYSRP